MAVALLRPAACKAETWAATCRESVPRATMASPKGEERREEVGEEGEW